MGRLDGKVCVITGAGGGMGREAAIVFTAEGAKVCVADLDLALAEETVSLCDGRGVRVAVDVADEDGVSAMCAATAEHFGGIDVLYNNAGISPGDDASVLDTSVEAWQRVQDVNTKGRLPLLQARDPVPARAGWGLGDQRRVVRRDPRCRDVTDFLHRVEGRRPRDVEGARRAVRARRACA